MSKNVVKFMAGGFTAVALVIGGPSIAIAANNSNAGNNITICHATGSQTNPYVSVTANANGIISAHIDHQDTKDIIPPFTYNDHGTDKNYPGQNFDANGQATLNNNCVPLAAGQGGGSVLGSTTTNTSTVGAVGGRGAGGQANAAEGGVGAGFGGAATAVNGRAVAGIGVSVLSIAYGLILRYRRKV